jgi:hypothetical protein
MPRLRGSLAGNALAIILVLRAINNIGGRATVLASSEQQI